MQLKRAVGLKRDLETNISHGTGRALSGFKAVLCLLIRNFTVSNVPKHSESTNSNSIRTISRAISFGVINYFSLLSEQMSLR